jgi:flagellin
MTYDTSGAFSITDGTTSFGGTIPSGSNDGTNMITGTAVTLSNTGTSNSIELILNTAFIVNTAHAAGTLALSGSSTQSFIYKVGTGTSPTSDEISVTLNSISAGALGLATTNVTTKAQSDAASVAITGAIDTLNNARANLGASQNRLEFSSANIATTLENTEAARSNLLDLDIAAEMSNFTSKQILVQAGVAMLAQANQQPQALLQLLQN